jgi:hypothetical protein
MCEVNVIKLNSKPRFGDVKVGDMFQGVNNYWYMKVKIKDGRPNEQTVFALGLEDGLIFRDFHGKDEIKTFFTPSAITVE